MFPLGRFVKNGLDVTLIIVTAVALIAGFAWAAHLL